MKILGTRRDHDGLIPTCRYIACRSAIVLLPQARPPGTHTIYSASKCVSRLIVMMKSTVRATMRLATIRLSSDDLHRYTPAIVGGTATLVVILIIANPGSVVPNSYTCLPWSDDQMPLPLNFDVKSWQRWIFVNVVLFTISPRPRRCSKMSSGGVGRQVVGRGHQAQRRDKHKHSRQVMP